MTEDSRKIPSHETTYARLRDMVLFGTLQPGQPVTIQGLVTGLEAGMTPVREALRRLTAEGALLPMGNRRVSVPRLTLPALEQLAFARLTIEPKLAEMALANLTPELVQRLQALDQRVTAAIHANDIHEYLESNHAFHFTLYEASRASILIDISRSLWLRFGPSLRVVCSRVATLGLPDQHLEALDAIRSGQPGNLAKAIERDIAQGVNEVRAALIRDEI